MRPPTLAWRMLLERRTNFEADNSYRNPQLVARTLYACLATGASCALGCVRERNPNGNVRTLRVRAQREPEQGERRQIARREPNFVICNGRCRDRAHK